MKPRMAKTKENEDQDKATTCT